MPEIIAQIIGIFAAAMNILSYQMKSKRNLLIMQLMGSFMFSFNYIILGAYMGGLMNVLAVIRALLFINQKRMRINGKLLISLFVFAFVACYVMTFTLLGKEPTPKNLIIEALPVIGMTFVTFSFNMKNATAVRIIGLSANSPCWLVYNVCSGSIGAIICEVVSIISLVVGIIRHDIPWARRKQK